jgi:hypothetical protein
VIPRRLGGGRSRIVPAGITAPPIPTAGPALSTAAVVAERSASRAADVGIKKSDSGVVIMRSMPRANRLARIALGYVDRVNRPVNHHAAERPAATGRA